MVFNREGYLIKYFERTVTRMGENSNTILAWCKGEEKLGLKNSLFICENGIVTQFHEMVKNLTEREFNKILCDEIDNYPELANDDMKRRLMRIREFTHEEAYKFKEDGIKDFIIYKGILYKVGSKSK